MHTRQADLEKDEEDLAEDKKVRVLACGGVCKCGSEGL